MDASEVVLTVIKPCLTLLSAGLVGGSGGVANLKTVPYIEGVTDVLLRSVTPQVPKELPLLGIHIATL
jgi:hypothetical protein